MDATSPASANFHAILVLDKEPSIAFCMRRVMQAIQRAVIHHCVAKAACFLNMHPQGAERGWGMCVQQLCYQTQSLPSFSDAALGETIGQNDFE